MAKARPRAPCWERVLDMDYGSMEIVKLDEMLPVAERLVQRLRTL